MSKFPNLGVAPRPKKYKPKKKRPFGPKRKRRKKTTPPPRWQKKY